MGLFYSKQKVNNSNSVFTDCEVIQELKKMS
jgi:hypothetical protein